MGNCQRLSKSTSSSSLPSELYTCQETKELDRLAVSVDNTPSIHLMKWAGQAAFELILERWPETKQVFVFCGGGNNGGDGFIVAALCAQRNIRAKVLMVEDPQALQGDARTAYDYAQQESVECCKLGDADFFPGDAFEDPSGALVVDALAGIGLRGPLKARYSAAVSMINTCPFPVLAIDVPSGLDADTGSADVAVKADVTITFIGLKPGLITGDGPALCGDLEFCDLGLSQEVYRQLSPSDRPLRRVGLASMGAILDERPANAHKGDFGHTLVMGGDQGMGGAAIMSALAAARSGSGLVSIATRPENVAPALGRLPEAMVRGVESGQDVSSLLDKASTIVVGPGLGQSAWSEQLYLMAMDSHLPMVLDADGLNWLARSSGERIKRNNWVLTPHPGEAARLLSCSVAEIQSNRIQAAVALQQTYGGVLVLKGAGSIVATDAGVNIADVGNPGMASGGMGDVLSGLIGALLAQGLGAAEAASYAVCLHGEAADLAALDSGQVGMLATDLIPYIRELLN